MKRKILFLLIILFGCMTGNSNAKNNHPDNPNETNISTFNEENYGKDWKKVDSLINKGLPKSALEIVNRIYDKAIQDNNDQQFVKAIIYKMILIRSFEEDFLVKNITRLKSEIEKAKYPAKSVLHSLLAEVYWGYYSANRYKILGRSITVNFDNNDITTWDLKKIVEQSVVNYKLSLEKPDVLKKVSLKYFDAIIDKGKGSKKYRPTLYDFLAHRAIDFFISSDPYLTKPADYFELNKREYFNSYNEFVKLEIKSTDEFSMKFYALKIFQELIDFHIDDKDPGALIDVDLKRIKFLKTNSTIEHRDSIYILTLKYLEKKHISHPASADVSYEIAKQYFTMGQQYNPLNSKRYKWFSKNAYDECHNAIERFPKSDGAINCQILLKRIKATSLILTTQYFITPGKPFPGLLSYKNISKVYLRIIKIDPEKEKKFRSDYSNEGLINRFLQFPSVKDWEQELIDDNDFQEHSVEVKLPELSCGYYIILVGTDNKFSCFNNSVTYSRLWVSNISYISRKNNRSHDFYVLDRDKGTPLKGVIATAYTKQYNYNSRNYETTKWKTFISDKEGYFNIPPVSGNKSSKNYYIDFTYKDDRLITDNYFYQYGYRSRVQTKSLNTFFFTDRAIYRPGQTIYFKGILLENNGGKYSIKPNQKTKVTFYDVNYEEISQVNLITNEYGSFSGTFTAPVGVLNGRMRISNKSGNIEFKIEEYKRPKFEVTFNPVKGSYKLDEMVSVKGKAIAYAGSSVDNASVKYRVTRSASFPYWKYWWGYNYSYQPPAEIINGVTSTNENGEFTIDFKAIPDVSINKTRQPVYNYSVSADVTDINGETHSAVKNVSVGYTALLLGVNIPEDIDKTKKQEFKITSSNLNGEREDTKGKIKIYKLKQPGKIFRQKLWHRPDKFIMTKQEYYSLFPHDVYDDENNKYKWAKEKIVLDDNFDTKEKVTLKFDNLADWDLGYYKLEMKAKDKYGEEVTVEKYFTIYSSFAKKIPENSMAWFTSVKETGEPGEKASFLFGTKDKNVYILYEIEHNTKIISKQWMKFSDQQKLFEIPIIEDYRGNFSYHLTFIKNNRSYSFNKDVTVPYTNKQLDIEFETFRNKLLPGQEEEWKIKIKGWKGEKVAAEMIASMYDASLDAFAKNYWHGITGIYPTFHSSLIWLPNNNFTKTTSRRCFREKESKYKLKRKYYDKLNWFEYNYSFGGAYYRRDYSYDRADESVLKNINREVVLQEVNIIEREDVSFTLDYYKDGIFVPGSITLSGSGAQRELPDFSNIQIRKNFNETAFFFPQLQTNEEGDVIFKFTIPEALTRWKMMGFAHTKDLKYGSIQKELITQKDLMVLPNAPRFFREGDKIFFSTKISNVSDKDLNGDVKLMLFNALTMDPVDVELNNNNAQKQFTTKAGQSDMVSWELDIPEGISAITYRIVAKSGNISDGEEMAIPVLTNRMLVTESLPLPVKGKETKEFTFTKLKESGSSTTLRNHKLTLEYTSNPAWYAIQALPYLMEYPYQCSEQVFSRYYANSIASYIVNSNPKIKSVFDSWKNFTPDALQSNLEKNQELKALLLEETPWVLNAKNESERKQRIALLFDLNKMSNEVNIAVMKLQKMQADNGGWPWFEGMPDSRYITQHIVTGFGHLDHLGIKDIKTDKKIRTMIQRAIYYLDDRMREDYERILKYHKKSMEDKHIGSTQIHYLYARSYFFKDFPVSETNITAFEYFKTQANKYWLNNNRYLQGMTALALNRFEGYTAPQEIIKSLKENALHSEEMGMYWRDTKRGYFWYEAPIETQALLIETFDEVAEDKVSVEDMKVWLLKQKQTQDWKTTKATVEACYALLLRGTDLLTSSNLVVITIGDQKLDPNTMEDVKIEAGTGYFKTSWSGADIKPEMGNITVTKTDEGVAWGAIYWQYFERLDKITTHKTPLKLDKKLFVEKNTASGPVIEPVTENTRLKPGDKIKVRIELRVDRDMEYVHMKDMRASGLEPVNVISRYKYQDGLGYYESTRDAATNFFFSYLRKGTYVFEYPLVVSQRGDFSNGITTIQCMYAPEFTSHSEGIRIKIGE